MKEILGMALGIPLVLAVVDAAAAGEPARAVTRPADELFWVPTLDQAIAMGEANKVPIMAMGYSLVGDLGRPTRNSARTAPRRCSDPASATRRAEIRGESLVSEALGAGLDEAWLRYMKDRPQTARGYLENEHGRWMRGVSTQMLEEDESVRRFAREGELRPPGR